MDIYLCPQSSNSEKENLKKHGFGLNKSDIQSQLKKRSSQQELDSFEDEESVCFISSDLPQYGVSSGDIILFYTGDEMLKVGGFVERIEQSNSITEELYSSNKGYGVVFDNLEQIAISGEYISECSNWNSNHIIGFTRLADHSKILDDFGSIEAFFTEAKKSGIDTTSF